MRISIMIFVIVALVLVVYSNSLGGDFIWDDDAFVVHNDIIKDWRHFSLFFTRKEALAKGTLAGENYRPFVPLSHAIDYTFWKLNPMGYHTVNLLFHVFNALLVFWLVLMVLKDKYIALLSSVFFALHPVQTEAVVWISGRSRVLFLFFYLLSFAVYIRYMKKKNILLYVASLVLFVCGLLSREMAATLPAMLILYDLYFGKKERLSTKAVRYFPYFLVLEIFVLLRMNIIGKLSQTGFWGGSLYTTFLTMAKGFVRYVELLVFPLKMCADYSGMPPSTSLLSPGVLPSIVIITSLFVLAVYVRKYSKRTSFFALWFFVAILPVSNIIPIKIIVAERFLYLPSIGFCALLSMMIVRMYNLKKHAPQFFKFFSIFIAVAIIGFYSVRTYIRNESWMSEEVFYEKVLEYNHMTPRALCNLSIIYMGNKEIDKAMKTVRKAVHLSPLFLTARDNLAHIYFIKQRYEDMANELDFMLKVDPTYARVYEYRGLMYLIDKEFDLAIREFRKIIAIKPDYLYAYYDIGRIYEAQGHYEKALAEYKEVLKRTDVFHYRPFFAAVSLRIGEIYFILGDREAALRQWRETAREYKDQEWAVELALFMTGKVPLSILQEDIENWHPRLQMIGLYYMGLKSEIDGNYDGAREFYKECVGMAAQDAIRMRLIAEDRLLAIKDKLGLTSQVRPTRSNPD